MQNKVILISIDGMRPDGLKQCGNPYLKKLEELSAYTYNGSSVFPSVTFPCHYSMSHSVTPMRHGILSNTYVPEVRPVKGLFELIKDFGGESAMFYGWEPLRDISRPASLKYATYINAYTDESTDTLLTDECISLIENKKPDLVFIYMVETDEKGGHDNGWMTEEYLKRISIAIDNVKRVIEKFGNEYSIIIMADHGGHDRMHGTDMVEDMTVPFFFYGNNFTPGEINKKVSLLEIAPTIAKILQLPIPSDWEGHPIY